MMSSRLFCLVALLGLVVLPVAGCGTSAGDTDSGDTRRVILLTNGADPFWDAMRVGMKDAEKDFDLPASGLSTVMDVNDGTPKGQVDRLRQYANQSDIAAVAVSVTDSANPAIADAMQECHDAGIQVIAIDSDVDRQKNRQARFAYLGTDNVIGGQELGRAAAAIRPAGGKYATFVGLKGAANAIERIAGFAEGAGEAFEQVESLGDGMDRNIAKKNVRDALDRNPQLETLVGIWAYNADAIVSQVKEQGIRDATTVVVFDAAPAAIVHMGDGQIDAMVVQNPYEMGYLGTRLMKALVEQDHQTIHEILPAYDPQTHEFADEPDADIRTTGLRVVYPDSGTPLTKETFSASTEFISLGEFRKWLAEHDLTGS